jgi:hypothetical protein
MNPRGRLRMAGNVSKERDEDIFLYLIPISEFSGNGDNNFNHDIIAEYILLVAIKKIRQSPLLHKYSSSDI